MNQIVNRRMNNRALRAGLAGLVIAGIGFVPIGCQRSVQQNAPLQTSDALQNGVIAQSTTPAETANVASHAPSAVSVADARIRREILLHAAMYRAAHESNVGDFTRHFLLESMVESDPPNLGIDPAEFRERVLAELRDLKVNIAWVPEPWRTPGTDYFPGTNELATRLRISIAKRDENQATIVGEVSDWTASVGSSRQGITATWDGMRWQIERDRVRLVW